MSSNSKGNTSSKSKHGMVSYPLGVYENQALSIAPQYLNGTHPFSLDRYDVIIQFIINYITSCGLHGSCWKQILSAMNQISSHQNSTKTDQPHCNHYSPTKTNKKKIRRPSISPKKGTRFDPYSLCSFWHSFHDKHSTHSHKSHKRGTYYAFVLHQFISYLKRIHQTSDHPLPFTFYLIDKRIQFTTKKHHPKQEMDDDDSDSSPSNIELTSSGVHYPCMKDRVSLSFDDVYVRYNKFKTLQAKDDHKRIKSSPKSLNDKLLSTCFVCDIYMVSNLSLRRRYLGYTTVLPEISLQINASTPESPHSALRYCILEKLGRAGVKGLVQTDLISELKTQSKDLFSAIKHLQHLGLLVVETDLVFSNCNHLWLSLFQFRSSIRTFDTCMLRQYNKKNNVRDDLLQLFAYNQYYLDNKKTGSATDPLRMYKQRKEAMNELHERYKQSLIPSSHALYCYNAKVEIDREIKIRFIDEYIVPKLLQMIDETEHKELGVMMKDLKDCIKTMDFTQSLPLHEIFAQIKWEEVSERLKKQPQLEIHRVFSDESTQIFRTFRMKQIKKDSASTQGKDTRVRYIDQGLNAQIYRLIYDAGTNGILATTLYAILGMKPKDGCRRIKVCSKTYDIVSITQHSDKSKPNRLFIKHFYDELSKAKTKQKRQNVMPRFNKRLDLLRQYLNDNAGVASAIELRRYLKTKDDDFDGDVMLLDSKTFCRLTDKLIKQNEIKMIHYKVNDRNKVNSIRTSTHPVILKYAFTASDPEIIKLAKDAIHRSATKNSHILSQSKLMTKVSKEHITPKKDKKKHKLAGKKRRYTDMNINTNHNHYDLKSESPTKKRKLHHHFQKKKSISHALYCSYYGYIRPTMARVRLLHEYLLQYKKNEDMGLIEDIEYDEMGFIVSPVPSSSPPPRPTQSPVTPTMGTFHSSSYPNFSEYNANAIPYEKNRNLTPTSPYHRRHDRDRLRYHNHYTLPSPHPQDDMINTLQPLRRNQSDTLQTRKKKKTLKVCPFINILKTFPFKLFLQIIGGDHTIPNVDDDTFWNVRICNLPPQMYAVIMSINDCRTMRLCRLIDQLKKLELLEFVKNPYREMMMKANQQNMNSNGFDDDDDGDVVMEENDEEMDKKRKKKKKKKKSSKKKSKSKRKPPKKKKKKKPKSSKKKGKSGASEEALGAPQIEIVDLGFLETVEDDDKYLNYKIKKAKPSEIIHIHSTQITMDNVSMNASSITGGREWPLTSTEKIDTFWKEFKKEVHIILDKYPQLSTAKRMANANTNSNEDVVEKDEGKGKAMIRRYYRHRYDDEEDEECDESKKKSAATKVQSLFNSRPIIISEYPIEEFPRLYAVHEWDVKRISPQKQWQMIHRFNDCITMSQAPVYDEMRVFARDTCVSLEKMLSFLAYNKYQWLRDNYEYLRFSFVYETPTKEYIEEQMAIEMKQKEDIQMVKEEELPEKEEELPPEDDELQFVVTLKWSKEEDMTLMQCFSQWRETLAPNEIVDHTIFLKHAHKELRQRLHRKNEQITRRWRVIRGWFNKDECETDDDLDALERLCLDSTLYTSLLNIYRMSFLSGHNEERRSNQHFANLFQALIFENYTEVEAQNMRQALFDSNYFVVRERNNFSRLPRYDLPTAMYSFIEKPPLVIDKYNTKRRMKQPKKTWQIHKIRRRECLNPVCFGDILRQMTKDVFDDPFNDDSAHAIRYPIISLQAVSDDNRSMPSTNLYEILDVDVLQMVNDCYTEVLETEYGDGAIPVITDESDAIRFITENDESDHDDVLCEIVMEILNNSYTNQSISFGVGLDLQLFVDPQICAYFNTDSQLNVDNRNYLLSNIRYLYNRFEVLCMNEFTRIKLVSVRLLKEHPKLSYFCVFPYEYDPSEWQKDEPKKGMTRQRKHGIAFVYSFEECCVCNPWLTNDANANKPQIDDVFVFQLKKAIVSIIFDCPGIDLFCLYYNYVLKYVLTPYQLLKMCQSLRNEMKIKIVHKNICNKNTNKHTHIVDSSYRFFVTF
eukprot:523611_1